METSDFMTIKEFRSELNELSDEQFFKIFTPDSYYNLNLKGAIDTFYSNNDYRYYDFTMRLLYNHLLDLQEDIEEAIYDRFSMCDDIYEDDENYVDYLGFEWYNAAVYFLEGELKHNYYNCRTDNMKQQIL